MAAAGDWGQASQESEAEHKVVETSVVWLGRVDVDVEAVGLVKDLDLDWDLESE